MDNKNRYQALLRGKISAAISEARAAAVLTHQGVKGTVLEILLSKLFRPLLPADIGVGTGHIIDAYGNPPSHQIDIIIYNKAILPPVLVDETIGLFPIESVLYTIEVKTTLTASGLKSSNISAEKVNKNFKYLSGKFDEEGNTINHQVSHPRSIVFALNSDLKGNRISEAERYKNIYKNEPPYLSAICVAGQEYSYECDYQWITMRNANGFDEILAFIAGVTNTYRSVSETRGYPQLGYYVAPEDIEVTVSPSADLPELTVKCMSCGAEKKGIYTLDKRQDMTISNGTLEMSTPCECGGVMVSETGNYIIKKGKLVEITPNKI
ncbi:DUF6602 domain-containing protein [Cronobacter sakazakii]